MSPSITIVIPMAGYGTRLRPFTWSKPKPLVPLAGKTVLDYLVDMFRSVPNFSQAEFVFILGPTMGDQIEAYTSRYYPEFKVHYPVQPEMIGQSDAFWQAREFLKGPILIAFSDTLIESNFSFLADEKADAVAWVKQVPDPRRFGVAEIDENGWVARLIEKPQSIENNLVVVGCYYFREAKELLSAIKIQKEQDLSLRGEFYLVDAINILLKRGFKMRTENVDIWLDAGTTEALINTNRYLMDHGRENSVHWANLKGCQIIPPVNLHPSVQIRNATIGPYVSLGEGAVVENSTIENSIIGSETSIIDCNLGTSLIGDRVTAKGVSGTFNLGDDSQVLG